MNPLTHLGLDLGFHQKYIDIPGWNTVLFARITAVLLTVMRSEISTHGEDE